MRYNKKKFTKTVILIVYVFSILSCESKQKDKEVASLKFLVEQTLGKKLVIPDSIIVYKPFNNYTSDSIEISNSKLKIYSCINASCGACINHIKAWDVVIPELNKLNIPVVLIFESDDNFQLIQYLCNSGRVDFFPYPFFFDKRNEYTKLNKFMQNVDDFKTVLTDKDNNILLLGNPVRSERTMDFYLKEIQKRLKE